MHSIYCDAFLLYKGVLSMTRKKMERIKGLSEVKVLKIKEAAAKMMVTWNEYPQFRQLILLIA